MGRHLLKSIAASGAAVLLAVTVTVGGPVAPATAAEGSIEYVDPAPRPATDGTNGTGDTGDVVQVLFSLPGVTRAADLDLDSLAVTVDGRPVEAGAELAAQAGGALRRTTVLAIDASNSMARGDRFAEARRAAEAFLAAAPDDVYVGVVSFAGQVRTLLPPTLDRAAASRALADLRLSRATRLYDGVTEALRVAGDSGARSVLVLSDGKDTSDTRLDQVVAAVDDAGATVDVVALAQSPREERLLTRISDAGGGALLSARDAEGLTSVFAAQAADLARQVLVTATLPADLPTHREGTLAVSLEAGGEPFTDSAFVTLRSADAATATGPATGPASEPGGLAGLQPAPAPRFVLGDGLLMVGLAALALGGGYLLLHALGAMRRPAGVPLDQQLAAYTRRGAAAAAAARSPRPEGLTGSAVGMAERALAGNRGVEAAVASRLDGAGMALKPAEWLLTHAGITVVGALLGFLLSSGRVLPTLLLLVLGAAGPWLYLGLRRGRRLKAFNGQLADVLQLLSSSLSAGLSLAQSLDTVVREGTEPVAGEFRRALVEARLGVPLEDALERVAERMLSDDFAWVVMAVRIQREVGGNLAELLLNVAATLREREYLRRQVKALSAEGRLSAIILGGLPPVFLAYLGLVNPDYLTPMFTSALGWLLVVTMAVLIAVGGFWMSKLVKVEV